MGDTQKNWVKLPEMAKAAILNTISSKRQKKDILKGKPVMGGYQEKVGNKSNSCYADLSCCLLHW